MGTRERRQRAFSEREDLFLDAAQDLISSDGLLNLHMNRIAEKCEYSVGTIYLHFASKEDLLLALVTRLFEDYVDLVRRAGAWQSRSRDRMFAVGVADIVFLRRHPDYVCISQYSLSEMSWKATSAERRHAFLETGHPSTEIITGIVEDARKSGELEATGQTPLEMATGVWALCSGYHSLLNSEGMLQDFRVHDPYLLMCRHLQNLLDGLRWRPASDPSDAGELPQLIARIRREVFHEVCNEQP